MNSHHELREYVNLLVSNVVKGFMNMLVRNYSKFAPIAIAGLILSSFSNIATAVNAVQTPALSKLQLVSNQIPKPELVFKGQESYTNAGKNFQRYNLAVANSAAFPRILLELG
jgi:hypothetical protein